MLRIDLRKVNIYAYKYINSRYQNWFTNEAPKAILYLFWSGRERILKYIHE